MFKNFISFFSNRKKLFFLILLFISVKIASGQIGTAEKQYKARVYITKHIERIGALYLVSDSSIIITELDSKHQLIFDTIPYAKITKISFTKKGSGGIGFAVGAGLSIGLGIINATQEDDPESMNTDRMVDVAEGVLLAIPLGIIGAVVGSHSGNVFHINHEYVQFESMKNYLIKRHIIKTTSQ